MHRTAATSLIGIISSKQLAWSLDDWQENFARVYGNRNKEGREPYATAISRMFEEICEVLDNITGIEFVEAPLQQIQQEIGLELADVMAWIIAIAILVGINLEENVWAKFGSGCPTCKRNPCVCQRIIFNRQTGHIQLIGKGGQCESVPSSR